MKRIGPVNRTRRDNERMDETFHTIFGRVTEEPDFGSPIVRSPAHFLAYRTGCPSTAS